MQVHRGCSVSLPQGIAAFDQCSQPAGQPSETGLPGSQQQVSKARMHPQTGQGLTMRGDAPASVERFQRREQRPCLSESRGMRRVEPTQVHRVCHAPDRELQREAGQIGLANLGLVVCRRPLEIALGIQPVADTRALPTRTARPLLRCSAGNRHGDQMLHRPGRIEPHGARPPGIDDGRDVRQRQAGLGHGRGQHQLAPAGRRRRQGRLLGGGGLVTIQGQDHHIRVQARLRQGAGKPPDLRDAGQEHQNAARGFGERPMHGRLPMRDGAPVLRRARGIGPMVQADRMTATGAHEHRRITEQPGIRCAVHRRAHRQQAQVLAQCRAALQRQRQAQIGLQAALVALIEDHQTVIGERGVALDETRESAVGHDLDACRRPHALFQPHPITHGFADRFPALLGHAPRRHDGCEPSRLDHQDAPAGEPGRVKQRRRHLRGLAGAGRGLEHQRAACRQRAVDLRQQGNDGQGGCHNNLVMGPFYPAAMTEPGGEWWYLFASENPVPPEGQ